MMQEDVSLPFLLVDAGRTAGIHQPRIKGIYFFLHFHLLLYPFFILKLFQTLLFLL